ncbi:MAG: hypothetical protein WAM91_17505 [Candidatus Acidiferrales bacterium]
MNRKTARILFLAACIVIAILLLKQVVTTIVGGFIFAVALLVFGGLSNGFRKK